MIANTNLIRTMLILVAACLLVALASLAHAQQDTSTQKTVVVEEIATNQPSNDEKAAELWQQTKQKTGAAASTAAEFSKVQGTRALEATKTGVAKGADLVVKGAGAVADGSKKAWDATKDATGKAVVFTAEKASQAGEVISDMVKGDDKTVPVTDKSVKSSTAQ